MEWNAKVYDWLKITQHLLLPPVCHLCGNEGVASYDLCHGCLAELPRNDHSCQRCGMPLERNAPLCGACSRRQPPYEQSIIPFRYAAPLDHMLQQLKFHQRIQLAPTLAHLMVEKVKQRNELLPQCLIPVPMSRQRLRERGYNQALELARPLGKALDIPLACNSVQRQRDTVPQTALDGVTRRRNLRGAFIVRGELPRHVAIIDDVVTTGTTVFEMARTLKRAGVEKVEVWACARAGKGG